MRSARQLLGPIAAACGVIAAAGYLGWSQAEPPQYCAEGMVALRGPAASARRCCGEGQLLRLGACQGTPARCTAGMTVTPSGCVAESKRVPLAASRLRLGPADWEAERVLTARDVEVSAFELDSQEVTQAQWERCQAEHACAPRPLGPEPGLPMVEVTRAEAAELCRWRGGRLPSSAELALAAMGPVGRRYPWGDTGAVCRRAAFGLEDGPCAYGATGPELSGSHPSGTTPEGIYDLAGNVAEWTRAEPRADAGQPLPAATVPTEPTPLIRPVAESQATAAAAHRAEPLAEVRGGSWQDPVASALRTWNGRLVPEDTRSPAIGFRCAYEIEPPSGQER
jgi:sulfatase modifying factor 1